MVKRTEASNLHSIPTDCPQRDECMGWMNDMTPRIEQAIYNFDMSRFYPKYLDDVADTQDVLGRITDTDPFSYGGRQADPAARSEEGCVGKECVCACRSRWPPEN